MFQAKCEEGFIRNITAQVCDVNKPVLGVSKVMRAGNKVVSDEEGSYIQDKTTGEVMWLKEQGGMFTLKLWVRNTGF